MHPSSTVPGRARGWIGSVRPVEVACITLVAGTVAIGWNFARYRDGVNLVWWDARTEIFVGFLLFVWSIGVIGGGWAGWVLGLPLLLDVRPPFTVDP